jgi:concanavalin A-like lectin/glucanase superfamily protein/Big-like domain-containing protein/putative Ig domain-containing protein
MFAGLRIRTALIFCLGLGVPAIANAATVALAWDANPESNIGGYVLVYGTAPGSYSASVDVGSTTAYSIASLTSGTRYYFAVRAYNTSGVSGPLSGEVNELASDPLPPPPPDSTPPVILALTPAANASNVSSATAIRVRFDEALDPSSVGVSTFDLRTAVTNALVAAAVSYDTATKTAVLVPTAPLAAGVVFNATLKGGPTGVRDVAGNALVANTLWSFTVAPPPPPDSGLVAAYGFEEGTGTLTADASGQGNPGIISGAAWRPGKFGNSLEFDGLSNLVTVATSPEVNLTASLTIEAWVYPTSLTGWRTVLLKETTAGLAYALYANDNDPKPATYVRLAGTSFSEGASGITQIPLNTWTHLATTFDGSSLSLHVGGVLVQSQPASGSIVQSSGPLRLGGNAIWGEYFAGRIDEVRVYNRALSAAEIQADMSRPIQTSNRVPTVTTPGSKTGTEGLAVTPLAISAADLDGDALTYSASGLPTGLMINTTSGVISGTVGFNASATNSVIVTVNDGRGGTASTAPFTWTIALVNRIPTVTTPGPRTGTEGVAVTPLAITAADLDGDALTYSATGLPSGVTINAATGVVSGTVSFNATASNTVVVTVNDGRGGTASTAPFSWTITLVNRVPTVTTPGAKTGTEGVAVTALPISASDPDADALTYSATGLPSGVTINAATGVVSGTVSFNATASNTVVVTVMDGRGGTASTAPFSWTITLVNRVPTVTTPGPQTGTPGSAVTLAISATDPDSDALSYIATGLPSGVTINTATGVISGTVGLDALVTNPVVVTVTDGNGGSDSAAFTWTITAAANQAPVLTNPGPQSGTEGVAVTPLQIVATDADGDTLTYSATGRPSGITIGATTGLMKGTVAFTAKATNSVKVTVTDVNGGTTSTTFIWTITLVNRAPLVTNPGPQNGSEGQDVTPPLAIVASDPDTTDTLTYSASGLPRGVAIDTATGVISGTVAVDALAANAVQVTVTDGNGGTTAVSFSWTIAKTPPMVVAVTPPSNGTNVSSDSIVTATFYEPLDPSSVGAPTFELRTASTSALVAAVVSYDATAKTAILRPAAPLAAGGSFTATIKGGLAGVRDLGGDTLAADSMWSFTVAGSAPAPGSGLVAAYGFDEGAGTVTADWSGGGHTGTLSGAAWQSGKFGKSLAFDGLSSWVTVAASGALNVTTSMTMEAWVYPTEAGGWRTVVFKEAPEEVWKHSYGLYSAFGAEGPGGHVLLEDSVNLHAPAALAVNEWSHLATTYNGSMLRLFVNGTERAAVAATGSIDVSAGDLRIGGNAMWGDFFKGRIDEVRLYNRALTLAEIQSDMSTPIADGPVAAYSFDEGAGLTARDDTGRLQTGTITGATWTSTGRFGSALRFDGVNDWVTVADSSWLDLTREMTLEAWVYPTAGGGWRTVLQKQAGDWYTFALYSDGSTGPNARMMLLSDTSVTTPAALAPNAWTHLAATYDGSTLRLFVNGLVVSSTPATGLLQTSSDPLRFGGNSIWGEHFAGVIDEVRVYNRALTVAEIQRDMTTPIR